MVKSIAETVVDTLGEVDPQKYMQEQLGQAQTAAGGVEGAKEKYGVKGYQSGGELLIKPKFKKTPKNRKKSSLREGAKEMAKDMAKMNAPFMVGVPVFLGSTIGSSKLSEYREKKKKEQIGRGKKATPEIKAEGAKQGGMMKMKKGGKVKQILKKIEETSNRVPRQGPKTDIKKMPKNFSEFGVDVDPTDKKPFVYGVKKTGKDTFIHGASKGKKDYVGSIEKGSFKGSYERSLKGDDVVKGTYSKNGFRAGVSKSGGNKQFTLGFEKKFKQGGMVCRGQGKARKKNFKVY